MPVTLEQIIKNLKGEVEKIPMTSVKKLKGLLDVHQNYGWRISNRLEKRIWIMAKRLMRFNLSHYSCDLHYYTSYRSAKTTSSAQVYESNKLLQILNHHPSEFIRDLNVFLADVNLKIAVRILSIDGNDTRQHRVKILFTN
jgi:hypothetical protein